MFVEKGGIARIQQFLLFPQCLEEKKSESCATTVLSTSNDFKIFWCGKEWVVIGFQLVNLYNGDLSVEREIRQEF